MLAWFFARLRAFLIPPQPRLVPVPVMRRPLRRRMIDL
jgi:hypothetical protein